LAVFNLCTELFASYCQFLPVFTGFFHCPGKNTFCHGKNPTLSQSNVELSLPNKMSAIYTDIEKAFDKVPHNSPNSKE